MARLPGLGRWRGESALPPLLVRGRAGPVAFPGGPQSSWAPAPRRPGQAAPPQRRAAARAAGPPRAPGPPRGRGPLSLGAWLPSPAPTPWAAAEPRGEQEGPPEESGRARTQAPPPEPLCYRSGDDDQGRVVAANLSRGH
ncbi:sterile alpha motif domain-containing protein 1-like [Pongo abelii]|uniref:sterile alpha motif domain-containing protein 1-like n=1 Tax=Pongo abelii TaxID=9601 RepID=UPI003007D26D